MIYSYQHSLQLIEVDGFLKPSQDPAWLVEHFEKHVKLADGDIVLDMGCGNGIITLLLAQRYPHCHFHGVDINPQLTQQAKQNANLNNLENCTFETVDLLAGNLNERYSHVISNPPYHLLEKGFTSPNPHKLQAHGCTIAQLQKWFETGLKLRDKAGTFTTLQHSQNIPHLEGLFKGHTVQQNPISNGAGKVSHKTILHIQG